MMTSHDKASRRHKTLAGMVLYENCQTHPIATKSYATRL